MEREAVLYEKLDDNSVRCFLCNHYCRISPSMTGFCGIRENLDGTLYTRSYGRIVAAAPDPIEKKPFYHFLPGTKSFSIATQGCNFRCEFCQNWQISQGTPDSRGDKGITDPAVVVREAKEHHCRSIAYTYTEPTIFFEYAYDIARIAHREKMANVFVTNGYMTDKMIEMMSPYLSAANIDLKSFNDKFYKERCQGRLQPVLDSIRLMKKIGVWIEVTTLIVPGENDSADELQKITEFLASVDDTIPWHISRFYPQYKFQDHVPTGLDILYKAKDIAKRGGLKYVYLGNVGESIDTECPYCGEILVRRDGFFVSENKIEDGKCPKCGELIAGIWG